MIAYAISVGPYAVLTTLVAVVWGFTWGLLRPNERRS